jgi:hypothetical protein
MAKNADYDLRSHKKERIAYGVLIAALGCLWMAVELGWLSSGMPIGPIIVIIIGFAFFLPWLKD